MACGTPVLACNGSSGVETVVNSNTGFLLGTDLDELIPFLKNVDRHELLRMRRHVRGHVKENFDIDTCYGRVFKFYEDICGYQADKNTEHPAPNPQTTVSTIQVS
jgi:glycosyltransferase involved in cell wall biosynthesis